MSFLAATTASLTLGCAEDQENTRCRSMLIPSSSAVSLGMRVRPDGRTKPLWRDILACCLRHPASVGPACPFISVAEMGLIFILP